MSQAAIHQQALIDLEQGRPLAGLKAWRHLLRLDEAGVRLHLQAADRTLAMDPLGEVRRIALSLANRLLANEPSESDVNQLGTLLQRWGEACVLEVPSRALQHFERAWGCGRSAILDSHLSSLYARLGFETGAHARAVPPIEREPWPQPPCLAQSCREPSCFLGLQAEIPSNQPPTLHVLPDGHAWVQRHANVWRHSHGVAVQCRQGQFQAQLCRHYPWPWSHCPHRDRFERLMQQQLEHRHRHLPPPLHVDGPVLAVAELSGEMFFHWQLELLPRLGRCWEGVLKEWPNLRLWHNGRKTSWVMESLKRLGIEAERVLPDADHISAKLLIVPSFTSTFGTPSEQNMAWLEHFWNLSPWPDGSPPTEGRQPLWLGREGALHRPVLGLNIHKANATTRHSLERQWREMRDVGHVITPHGAGMSKLLGCRSGAAVTELVNPAYAPPYFQPLIRRRKLQHQRLEAATTPLPLQEWLYESPMTFPIDLRPGLSEAAEVTPII
jgi:hypothetical protein